MEREVGSAWPSSPLPATRDLRPKISLSRPPHTHKHGIFARKSCSAGGRSVNVVHVRDLAEVFDMCVRKKGSAHKVEVTAKQARLSPAKTWKPGIKAGATVPTYGDSGVAEGVCDFSTKAKYCVRPVLLFLPAYT